jgi:hypothetical protein
MVSKKEKKGGSTPCQEIQYQTDFDILFFRHS